MAKNCLDCLSEIPCFCGAETDTTIRFRSRAFRPDCEHSHVDVLALNDGRRRYTCCCCFASWIEEATIGYSPRPLVHPPQAFRPELTYGCGHVSNGICAHCATEQHAPHRTIQELPEWATRAFDPAPDPFHG